MDERLRIADLAIMGVSLSEMAMELGRSKSTICRELARNGSAGGKYAPYAAQKKAEWRARRPKPTKLASCPELRDFVVAKLEERWSPEQISASLIEAFPEDQEMRVSHETIYQSIFVQGRGELRVPIEERTAGQRATRCGLVSAPRRKGIPFQTARHASRILATAGVHRLGAPGGPGPQSSRS